MQIISQFAPLPLTQPEKGTAVAMGYFDGIHIGHRAVIEGAVQWAKTHDAAPAVFTFRLPVENKMKGKRLLSTEDKHALIHSLGVEYYLTPDFEAIKALSPEEFVRGIVENCHARALFCGENFTFGAKAAGTPELLRTLCAPLGVEVVVVPMAQFEEKPVSSTRIRTALEGGDIPAAWYTFVTVTYIANAQIGFHIPWMPAYIIGVCAAAAYVIIVVWYGNKRAARLQKL